MTDMAKQVINGLFAEDPDRDYIAASVKISRAVYNALSDALEARENKKDKCTFFLTTLGGNPDAGYRIARCLRSHYQHVRIAIPSMCKSAGTLIAIGADELGIGDRGELGPLDIQVSKGTELWEQSSGLDIQQALQTATEHVQEVFMRNLGNLKSGSGLSTRLCVEFSERIASSVASPLLSQIDPIRLGEMQRATRVAHSYGQRLDAHTSNLKKDALQKLIGDYPSHSFVIDRKEASELFHRVTNLTIAEGLFCKNFWPALGSQSTLTPIIFDMMVDHSSEPEEQPEPENVNEDA